MGGYCRKTDRLGVGFELKNNRNGLWRGKAPRRNRSNMACDVVADGIVDY
jgi:hypothetical protein